MNHFHLLEPEQFIPDSLYRLLFRHIPTYGAGPLNWTAPDGGGTILPAHLMGAATGNSAKGGLSTLMASDWFTDSP